MTAESVRDAAAAAAILGLPVSAATGVLTGSVLLAFALFSLVTVLI